MEVGMATIAVSVLIATLLTLAGWKVVNWVWLTPKKVERILRQQHLSGNSYRLLIGDAIGMLRMHKQAKSNTSDFSHDIFSRVDPFLHQTIKNHGKNPFAWLGTMPVVVVTEAGLAKEILSRMSEFPKPYFRASALIAPGVASYEGEKWAKHRKLVNPAFHMEKLKVTQLQICQNLKIMIHDNFVFICFLQNLQLMVPAFQTSCSEMIMKWEDLVSETGSVELDVWSHLTSLTADVISRAAFGSSSFGDGRKAFELIQEQTEIFTNSAIELIFPGLRFLPTSANRRFNKAQKGIKSIIKSVIEKRRKNMEAGEAAKDDLLGLLMKHNVEMHQDENNKQHLGITTEELIDECKVFYFAGQENTSTLLAFTMIMLGKYTDWQTQAREHLVKIHRILTG